MGKLWFLRKLSKSVTERLDLSKFRRIPDGSPDVSVVYTKGGGPGGQSVATASNKVVLKHIPTGEIKRPRAT